MDLLTLLRLFRRNVIATILAAALAAALVGYVVISAPPVYRSSGSVVLFSPPQPPDLSLLEIDPSAPTTTVASDNPYVRFNDLSVVVDIVRRVLLSTEIDSRLREAGVVGTYSVAANIDFYRGPIIDIADEAETPLAAQRSTKLVMAQLGTSLDALQERQGTDPDYRIKAQSVVEPNPGTRVYSSTLRRGLAVSVLAAGMAVGVVLIADAVRRRARRSAPATADDADSGRDLLDDALFEFGIDLKVVSESVDETRNPGHGYRHDEHAPSTVRRLVREVERQSS